MSRSYNDELQYLDKIDKNCWRIKKGFVPNMRVRGRGPGCPGRGSEEGARGRGGPGGAGRLTALPAGGGRFLRERPAGEADVRGAAQCLPRRRWVRAGAECGPSDPGGDRESVGLEKLSEIVESSLGRNTTMTARPRH